MNKRIAQDKLIQFLDNRIIPFSLEEEASYGSLIDKIGESRFVLMGEATHGTHEFYYARCELTRYLLMQKGFMAVAIEGDWPDVYQIHRYVQGREDSDNCAQVLNVFKRFPTWMWRNKTLLPFLKWLRNYNDTYLSTDKKIGFYGLDLYSLYNSIQSVVDYLKKVDPSAAEEARERYSCFDHINNMDPQHYGRLVSLDIKKSCIKQAIEQLLIMQHRAFEYLKENGSAEDDYFFATQNARVVKNAENYYRSMFSDNVSSWNIRDSHMFETLNSLSEFLEKKFNRPAKIIIWAHNSHVGDARATEMSERGELNIGQLVREQHGNNSFHLGFSTYKGTVIAASNWDGLTESKKINPGLPGSYEEIFHFLKNQNFLLDLRLNEQLEQLLQDWRLQRAIGVIYRPDSERFSHYFFVRLPYQFDSILHFDSTSALQPL